MRKKLLALLMCATMVLGTAVTASAYSADDVDFFATMYQGECYLIPYEICGKRVQRLRIIPTKNGQTKGIIFAKDYHIKDVIERL